VKSERRKGKGGEGVRRCKGMGSKATYNTPPALDKQQKQKDILPRQHIQHS